MPSSLGGSPRPVRRIRNARYADIAASCNEEILDLRVVPLSWNVNRELWVRGPDRYRYRYNGPDCHYHGRSVQGDCYSDRSADAAGGVKKRRRELIFSPGCFLFLP